MSDLLSFQQRFAAALENPALVPDADLRLRRALTVHRNTVIKAAQDALADNYPVVRALVGEEAFAACATGYAEAYPPCDPRLCLYGEQFDAFLAGYVPFGELPWLVGMACLEWLRVEPLFATDAEALEPSSITGAFSIEARLRLHPAVRMLASDAPVASLWLAHQPWAAAEAIQQVEWRPEIALITRPADRVIVRVIQPDSAAFLQACAQGAPLGEAARAADAQGGDVAQVFATLIIAGAFVQKPDSSAPIGAVSGAVSVNSRCPGRRNNQPLDPVSFTVQGRM
jgi:Putative DNA-binding domain